MRAHRLFFFLTLALATVPVASTHAQTAQEPPANTTAAATERARKLFVEATRLYDEGKYPQAYVAFAAAWAIKKHPSIAGNLADCEVKVGRLRDAAEHYRYMVKDSSGDAKPEDKRRAQARLDETLKRIGVVTVTGAPNGAVLSLDGAAIGDAPLSDGVFVEPGEHTIEVRAEGYSPQVVTFNVSAGSSKNVQLSLRPKGSGPVSNDGRRSVIPGVVLGSVAGVALLTGIGLYAGGRAKAGSASELHDAILEGGVGCVSGAASQDARCDELLSTASTGNTLQRAGVGLMLGAGAAAIGTVIYFVLPSRGGGAKGSAVQLTPMLQPNNTGLVLSGTF